MRAALLLALLLGACGGEDNTPQAQCRRQAYDDPQARQLMTLRLSSEGANVDLAPRYEQAVRQAEERCLTARGLAPRGGVAPVVRKY
jgi:hypothetical protein